MLTGPSPKFNGTRDILVYQSYIPWQECCNVLQTSRSLTGGVVRAQGSL